MEVVIQIKKIKDGGLETLGLWRG